MNSPTTSLLDWVPGAPGSQEPRWGEPVGTWNDLTDAIWTLALALGHTVLVPGSSSWCEACSFRARVDDRGLWGPGDYDHRAAVVAEAMVVTGELSAAAVAVFVPLAPTFSGTLADLVSTSEAIAEV